MVRYGCAAGALLLAIGCGGGSPDLGFLGRIVEAHGKLSDDPEHAAIVVLKSLVDEGVNVVPAACATDLREAAETDDPARRNTRQAKALGDCPATCGAEAIRSVSNLDPQAKTAALVAACDKTGVPDVFDGDAADLRLDMNGLDYLFARLLLERVDAATVGTPTQAGFRDMRRSLAIGLALAGRPWFPPPGPTPMVVSRVLPIAEVQSLVAPVITACAATPVGPVGIRFVVDGKGAVVAITGGGELDEVPLTCLFDGIRAIAFPPNAAGSLAVADLWLDAAAP